MLRRSYGLITTLAFLLAGCGSLFTQEPVVRLSHGGTLVSLPKGRGFAEILIETEFVGEDGRLAHIEPRLVIYFFRPDGTIETNSGLSEVKIRMGRQPGDAVFDLSPQPKVAGKYASRPCGHHFGFNGELDFKADGADVAVPFFLP